MSLLASVETGGTKVFAAVAERSVPHVLVETCRIPTSSPVETLAAVADFLAEHHRRRGIDAVGVASFGPLDTDPRSATHGWITTTPKPAWTNTDLHGLVAGLEVPIGFVTDVSGSLLGERWGGAATGLDDVCYVTVGTGIGVGVMVHGRLITGRATPELGHIPVRRHPDDDFAGVCPYHGDCLEGLASGPAVMARWGRPADSDEQVAVLAHYLGQLCWTITLALAPQRIVMGGGVAKTPGLLSATRQYAADLAAGYLGDQHPLQQPSSGFVVPPALGDLSGLHGGLEIAAHLLSHDG